MSTTTERAAKAARWLIDSASAAARAKVAHQQALRPDAVSSITQEDIFQVARARRQAEAAAAKALEDYITAAAAALTEQLNSGQVAPPTSDND